MKIFRDKIRRTFYVFFNNTKKLIMIAMPLPLFQTSILWSRHVWKSFDGKGAKLALSALNKAGWSLGKMHWPSLDIRDPSPEEKTYNSILLRFLYFFLIENVFGHSTSLQLLKYRCKALLFLVIQQAIWEQHVMYFKFIP